MAYTIEVKYFNSFWLKKVVEVNETIPSWPGLPWRPPGYPQFPFFTNGAATPAPTNYTPWFIEESRIKGGYNNTAIDLGVKAYITEPHFKQRNRSSSIIYSGIYNRGTNVNDTNVFSVAESISKSLNPAYGNIQKLYAEDSNLVVFQEHKINRALIDKDTIYTAEGGTQTQASAQVIGQLVPYAGEYGMSQNPESFAIYGYRKYFTDRNNGTVLRLSKDGITEISGYGMKDYFRDSLSAVSSNWQQIILRYGIPVTGNVTTVEVIVDVFSCCQIGKGYTITNASGSPYTDTDGNDIIVTNVDNCDVTFSSSINLTGLSNIYFMSYIKEKAIGAWDNYNKNYVLSIQQTPSYIYSNEYWVDNPDLTPDYETAIFDESSLGWTSFHSYKPIAMDSLRGGFYSFNSGEIWKHNDTTISNNRCNFYGVDNDASITFIFNPSPSITKNFLTVSYEGANGWEIDSFISGDQGPDLVNGIYVNIPDSATSVKSYNEGVFVDGGVNYHAGFDRKENRYVANLKNDSGRKIGEVVFGDKMSGIKGYFATVKISTDATTQPGGPKELFAVSSNFVTSSY
ncbi:MAG: hypothetical protein GY787_25170 [Alteromonadales bacterium]|nr:hypothetical protein [Alteromonadales bacterium]